MLLDRFCPIFKELLLDILVKKGVEYNIVSGLQKRTSDLLGKQK